jgi:hypothetical protein
MSWLVAVCFPGLLMVFTVGLQRLESMLHGDRPSAVDLVARLEGAARSARQRAAQRALAEFSAAPPSPPPSMSPAPSPAPSPSLPPSRRFDPVLRIDEPGLPTRPNPLFQPSGLGNRV